ncbi:MAG: class I SAM-dependent methyltransferase [Actinobacteria bacterium]|nr:class I SAM-dependent methyltransferase [Actinomycetota bacterium]
MTWGDATFDELAHLGEGHLDRASVAAYDRKAAFDPTEDVALLRGLGLDARATLVDLGAGTGTLALAAASHCRRVVAVDASPAMVSAMQRKAERLGVANVECVQSGFLSYGHQGAPADVVYSRNALHHLPDFWKAVALERIASMLGAGGTLRLRDIVYSFDPSEADRVIGDWLAGAAERIEDGWTRAELEAHLREEHSTFTWLLEPMLERAGLEVGKVVYRRGVYADYVCVKPEP